MGKLTVHETPLAGVVVIEPTVFRDARGFFLETYHRQEFQELGLDWDFVQDNHSRSVGGTLRGLHFQVQQPQGKLIRVLQGEIFDVAVDLRLDSPTFGQWYGIRLNCENMWQLYIPPGLAHGFCATSDTAEILYKCTDFYAPQFDRTLLWSDPQVAVQWPVAEPLLSDKDRRGKTLAELLPELRDAQQLTRLGSAHEDPLKTPLGVRVRPR